jgi:ABC-type bacteriocin/lantibiotic exporter with double-glycine peptidase domain
MKKMADNPLSWFILMCIFFYFLYRFLRQVINELEEQKAEREKAYQEIFLKNSLDKTNAQAYNRYINKGGNANEHYDD